MNNGKALLTVNYRLNTAQSFIQSIADNNYYFFVGNHVNSNTAPRPFDNEQDTLVSSYQGMIFGKRIKSNDASLMIRRTDWQSNTIYDMYDHRDSALYDKNFYVVIKEGTQYDVFKCLENGGGAPSTVAPSRTNVSSSGEDFYYPTDGYRWKYMYSMSDANTDKFSTSLYFPVATDSGVKANAVDGSIDVIKVVSPGKGYDNYINGAFTVPDIRLNGNPKRYGISTTGVKTTNGYYDACWLYISSGPGAGQYRLIESFTSNNTHNYVTLTDQFDVTDQPSNGSTFEITPSVKITGDGRQTLPANARAIINPNGNTVSRIEMIDRGANFFHATAEIRVSGAVGVVANAGIVPIMSPKGGHGSDAPNELAAKYAALAVKLVDNEGNTVITDNDYSQIGILKNPGFANVEVTITGANRDFYKSEIVYKVNTLQLNGTVSTTKNGNNQLTAVLNVNGVNATSIAVSGQQLFLSYANNYQLANVVSVSNTTITMDKAALFDTGSNTANIHLAWTNSYGTIAGFSTGKVNLTNVQGPIVTGDKLIGADTGVYATANTVKITGSVKTFDTFMQAFTYIGSMSQGSFNADELLFQIDNVNNVARFHSIAPDAATSSYRIYTTEQYGVFNTAADNINQSKDIKGSTSGAIATLTNKYLPDLTYGSGEVVYIEYGDAITRASEKTETFKLVFAF